MRMILLTLVVFVIACATEPQLAPLPDRSFAQEPVVEPNVLPVDEEDGESVSNSQKQTTDIDELKRILLQGIDGTQYHVTLDVSVSGNTDIKSTTEIFVKNEKSRVDTKATIDGQHIETRVIILEDEMISCLYEGSWECESFEIDSQIIKLTAEQMREQLDNETFYTVVKKKADRRLAGVLAKCYVITLPDMPLQEQCYSNEGAVLYQEFTIEGDHVVHRASAYSTSVDEKAFVAPK